MIQCYQNLAILEHFLLANYFKNETNTTFFIFVDLILSFTVEFHLSFLECSLKNPFHKITTTII